VFLRDHKYRAQITKRGIITPPSHPTTWQKHDTASDVLQSIEIKRIEL
jgi:hypothetical protein